MVKLMISELFEYFNYWNIRSLVSQDQNFLELLSYTTLFSTDLWSFSDDSVKWSWLNRCLSNSVVRSRQSAWIHNPQSSTINDQCWVFCHWTDLLCRNPLEDPFISAQSGMNECFSSFRQDHHRSRTQNSEPNNVRWTALSQLARPFTMFEC